MTPGKLGLGDIVWWSLPDDVPTKRSEWNTQYPDFPISNEPVGDPLRRALYAIEAPQGSRRLIRPLKTKGYWAVVIETPVQDDLDYKTEFTVKTILGHLEFVKSSHDGHWARELNRNYHIEADRVTSGAVADLILSTVRGTCLAVQTRKTGGVYFIPQGYADQLDEVEAMVQQLGGRLFRFPVSDKKGQREDLLHLVVEDLKAAVELVRSNLDTRHRNDAVLEAKRAKDRVTYYKDALGLIKEEAAGIEKQINSMLAEALTVKTKLKKGVK